VSEILWYKDDLSESRSFKIETIETNVNGNCYMLRLKGANETIEVLLDEAGVIEHNRLTLTFIKGYTYNRLNGKAP
jgi:hypothetical protein